MKSRAENTITKILSDYRVKFLTEYQVVKNPKTNRPLRFDFTIFNKDYSEIILLIEYDGLQHLVDKDLIERDLIKDNFAKENNIPLIRLSELHYSDLKKLREFLVKNLIPRLPESSCSSEKIPVNNRLVVISHINQKQYSIKELSNLLGYSESRIYSALTKEGWFDYKKDRILKVDFDDLVKGLINLGMLVSKEGQLISFSDSEEVVDQRNRVFNQKKEKQLITIYYLSSDFDRTKIKFNQNDLFFNRDNSDKSVYQVTRKLLDDNIDCLYLDKDLDLTIDREKELFNFIENKKIKIKKVG